MHFIDQDNIELDIPEDWDDTVANAKKYVKNKIHSSARKALGKALSEGWNRDRTIRYIFTEKVKARKKAINSKSTVWSGLSDILSKQSHEKCWYCETCEVRSDNPIDHFRPKNNVEECVDHPGYWWLAFDWKNYRYACTYCNSHRVNVETTGGKHDHFPLLPPRVWNVCEADTNNERPVLLDPCDADDCDLLTFDINGRACSTTLDEHTEEYIRADTSITLYHLNHIPSKRIRKSIRMRIKTLVENTNVLIDGGITINHMQIKSNKTELYKMIRPTCMTTKFNTAARTYLREFNDDIWVKNILESV